MASLPSCPGPEDVSPLPGAFSQLYQRVSSNDASADHGRAFSASSFNSSFLNNSNDRFKVTITSHGDSGLHGLGMSIDDRNQPRSFTGNRHTLSLTSLRDEEHNAVPEHDPVRDSDIGNTPLINNDEGQSYGVDHKQGIIFNDRQLTPVSSGLHCPTSSSPLLSRFDGSSVVILILCIFAVAGSFIFLVVAIWKPHYDVVGRGSLPPSTASLLSALIAKLIEMAFATVVVATIGQALSRRAVTERSTGISVSDMSMRVWVMMPGSLMAQARNVRYSAWTSVGIIAILSAICASLYTTASDALVSPKLTLSSNEPHVLEALSYSKFANLDYMKDTCTMPFPSSDDPGSNFKQDCMAFKLVGQAYRPYVEWVSNWDSSTDNSSDQTKRPPPTGQWKKNTEVEGLWLPSEDMASASKKHKRLINNVTLVFPHANVYNAAHRPVNHLRQPSDFDGGMGHYTLRATVAAPMLNVMCAGVTDDEISPLVFDRWPEHSKWTKTHKWLLDPDIPPNTSIPIYPNYPNKTMIDDIFHWGPKYGPHSYPPIFPKTPITYNTLFNVTAPIEATSANYLLIGTPSEYNGSQFVLCASRSKLMSGCSTNYHVESSGGKLWVDCSRDNSDAWHDSSDLGWDLDWKNVASGALTALSMNSGLTDGNASDPRFVTLFTPSFDNKTDTIGTKNRPSLAEVIAELLSPTLLMSSEFSSVLANPNDSIVSDGRPEKFSIMLRISRYTSGAGSKWQNVFYVILALVFIISMLCFFYLYIGLRFHHVTDFTDPQNLFPLAINSPPSMKVAGACGAGPRGPQLGHKWVITLDEQNEHYYITTRAANLARIARERAERGQSVGSAADLTANPDIRTSTVLSPDPEAAAVKGAVHMSNDTRRPRKGNASNLFKQIFERRRRKEESDVAAAVPMVWKVDSSPWQVMSPVVEDFRKLSERRRTWTSFFH